MNNSIWTSGGFVVPMVLAVLCVLAPLVVVPNMNDRPRAIAGATYREFFRTVFTIVGLLFPASLAVLAVLYRGSGAAAAPSLVAALVMYVVIGLTSVVAIGGTLRWTDSQDVIQLSNSSAGVYVSAYSIVYLLLILAISTTAVSGVVYLNGLPAEETRDPSVYGVSIDSALSLLGEPVFQTDSLAVWSDGGGTTIVEFNAGRVTTVFRSN